MSSQDVRIDAAARDKFGKGASRQFRREGKVPAVVYGSGSEVRHLVLPAHELALAGDRDGIRRQTVEACWALVLDAVDARE